MPSIVRLIILGLFAAWPIDASSQRVALVIGNGSYRSVAPLQNPPNDAKAVGDALRQLGFVVETLVDADRTAMIEAARRLASMATGAEVAVLFYAGHAIEARGRNMLLPVNIPPNAAAIDREALSYSEVENLLDGRASATIIILDSCRDSPFAAGAQGRGAGRPPGGRGLPSASRGANAGLAATSTASGMLVAFATAPGRTALDGTGQNSPFTTALLQHLGTVNLEIRQMLGRVRRSVREATGGQQIPWDNSSLEGEFFFRSSVPVARTPPRRPIPPAAAAVPIPEVSTRADPPRVGAARVDPPSSAQERRLLVSEMERSLIGATLEFREGSGRPIRMYAAPDSRAFINVPPLPLDTGNERGSWYIGAAGICFRWRIYSRGASYCLALISDGDTVFFMNANGARVDVSIRRGDPYGLYW